jgi:hypothetical protein
MPKDAKKNIDRYKIRGGELNEFDFHQNQEDYVKEKSLATKGTKSIVEKKTASPRGATAKKLAAQKAAKKK